MLLKLDESVCQFRGVCFSLYIIVYPFLSLTYLFVFKAQRFARSGPEVIFFHVQLS